ncbi:hypothetical protein FGG08_005695 [Glutinoglossum americanum]|uniref:Extracellular serine-rich protein n=1 Tax=Glutinoglossum americanum TaxID=1670608 RepID=A0A9P8L2N7_9PEZI|nr:hypothetical protein FGG08_005695 [Glutinoglossum americanum]
MATSQPGPPNSLLSLILCTLVLCFTTLTNCQSVLSTVLVIARDTPAASIATITLNGYGIPYTVLTVPQAGAPLPALNSTTQGNFGLIVVLGQVSYDYGASGWLSALNASQWSDLYAYQVAWGVRMVQLDVFPTADFGAAALGGCCASEEQLVAVSDDTGFTTAGLKVGATLSTQGIWHYPATITNASIATQFLQFSPNSAFTATSVAGVISNKDGHQQMAFFLGFATWSQTSTYLNHIWVHWGLRGMYTGYRRVYLNTQVDDMFLESDIYSPTNTTFRIRANDLTAHKNWMPTLNAKMNPGSSYFIEVGHNGNGNIEAASESDPRNRCADPIEYSAQIDTPLEFQKPLGSGTDVWPATPTAYGWAPACVNLDPLERWWATAANRNAFAHVSHTFTHLEVNNATYSDCLKEIAFNQAWLAQVGLSSATRFSGAGLIPPAITGLHNGDCLQAWSDRGIHNVIGDNSRPLLRNQQNDHWPLITTVEGNGFAGTQITPRWPTNIYYNCDLPACTVAEWIATAAGSGTINDLLTLEKATTTRNLFNLYHDPYMFHQANMRQTDVPNTTINGVSAKYSLLQMWVETVVQEMVRLVKWPIKSLKQDDIAAAFAQRMARDGCLPNVQYQIDTTAKTITGLVVSTTGNTCGAQIPITVGTNVTDTHGFMTEQLGNDPTTIWVNMTGSPVSFTFGTAIPW